MVLVALRFALRSYLAFPEDSRLFFTVGGRKVSITLSKREGAQATSFEGMDFSWIAYDESKTIVIGEPAVEHDREIVHFKMDWALGDFRGGQIVPTRFSVVSLFTELPHIDESQGFNLGEHVQWAETVLQNVIDVYRGFANEPYVALHDSGAMQVVLFGVAQQYTFDEHGTHGSFDFKTHHVKAIPPCGLDAVACR